MLLMLLLAQVLALMRVCVCVCKVQTVLSERHVPLTQSSGNWQQSIDTFTHTSGCVLTSAWHSEPSATHAASCTVHSPSGSEEDRLAGDDGKDGDGDEPEDSEDDDSLCAWQAAASAAHSRTALMAFLGVITSHSLAQEGGKTVPAAGETPRNSVGPLSLCVCGTPLFEISTRTTGNSQCTNKKETEIRTSRSRPQTTTASKRREKSADRSTFARLLLWEGENKGRQKNTTRAPQPDCVISGVPRNHIERP